MIDLFHDNFVVVLLVLFIGILYWAFKPKRRKQQMQRPQDPDN
jgi:cbb3-type cytochrome oxidase subunit 3